MLPVLCKRWARLLGGRSPAWESLTIRTGKLFPDEALPDAAAILAWFGRRQGTVKILRVMNSMPKLPGSLVAVVLGMQSASLRVLRLDVGASTLSATDLAVLSALTVLDYVTIHMRDCGPRVPGWDDNAASLMGTLSLLPALQKLHIIGGHRTLDLELPTVDHFAVLGGPALSFISCAMASTLEESFSLGTLPALASCRLFWEPQEGDVLHVTPTSFCGAPGVTQLSLWSHAQMQLAPLCFTGLSMLADLTLDGCGLAAIPAPQAGVQQSLRRLDVSDNTELQIDEAGLKTLLALPALERLVVEKAPNWTHDSIRFLASFHWEWLKLRPGAALPVLKV